MGWFDLWGDEEEFRFNNEFAKKFDEELNGEEARKTRVEQLAALGRLALYSRLYKRFAISPSGDRGFENEFPTPAPSFHKDIVSNCSLSAIVCLPLTAASRWLFPLKQENATDVILSELKVSPLLLTTTFSFDVSLIQASNAEGKNRVDIFERLPYCRFNDYWPSGDFFNGTARNSPLDELFNFGPFECADISFCPNACINNECPKDSECYVPELFNDSLFAMRRNDWNVTCSCANDTALGKREWRIDTKQCADVDDCFTRKVVCDEYKNEVCENHYKEAVCVCQLGYYWVGELLGGDVQNESECVPVSMAGVEWTGLAIGTKLVFENASITGLSLLLLPFFLLSLSSPR